MSNDITYCYFDHCEKHETCPRFLTKEMRDVAAHASRHLYVYTTEPECFEGEKDAGGLFE